MNKKRGSMEKALSNKNVYMLLMVSEQ